MLKTQINTIISNLKKANMISKVTPWMFEGLGDVKAEIRYVGLKLDEDWEHIFPPENNLLLKFILIKPIAQLEFYLANNPPFFKIYSQYLRDNDKWEWVLGELKRRLKKDKEEVIKHQAKIDNFWVKLQPHLKNRL